MDRVMARLPELIKRAMFFLGVAMGALGTARAVADVVFAKKAPALEQYSADGTGDDGFPESRFGSPPSPPDLGNNGGRNFVTRAFEELDSSDESQGVPQGRAHREGTRAPAGLVVGGSELDAMSGAQPGAIRPNAGSTGANARVLVSPKSDTPILKGDQAYDPVATAIQRKGVQEVALIAGDLGFFPKMVFVSRDVPVRLYVTGASKNTLCIMMDSFQVRKQVRSQKIEEITFTPNVPGRYRFYCPVNGSEGMMVVKELSS